jgi:hypothetical protein
MFPEQRSNGIVGGYKILAGMNDPGVHGISPADTKGRRCTDLSNAAHKINKCRVSCDFRLIVEEMFGRPIFLASTLACCELCDERKASSNLMQHGFNNPGKFGIGLTQVNPGFRESVGFPQTCSFRAMGSAH